MQPFTTHTGRLATLDRSNVDTDQIIPKQFLKSIARTGFGEQLFYDWRFRADGSPDPDFELNAPKHAGASILVTRNNFGCGSSREHAVWAIAQYGFRAIIAPWQQRGEARVPAFADIFRNNCGKNAVLTIELSSEDVNRLFAIIRQHDGLDATINLAKQTITLHDRAGTTLSFDVEPALKERLLKGLDDIGLTLEYERAIADFEKRHSNQLPAA